MTLRDNFIKSINNIPTGSVERILYIQSKYWEFSDSPENADEKIDFKEFCNLVYLEHNIQDSKLSDDLSEYSQHSLKATRCGFIIFNENSTKLLLVQNVNSSSWAFPKGKCNPNEPTLNCAIRETKEETNITIKKNNVWNKYVKFKSSAFRCKYMFYITNVNEKVIVKPKANEITNIKWFDLQNVLNSNCKAFKSVIKTLNTEIVQDFLRLHSKSNL
jgi:8-oxo-dGTP diphosphatase